MKYILSFLIFFHCLFLYATESTASSLESELRIIASRSLGSNFSFEKVFFSHKPEDDLRLYNISRPLQEFAGPYPDTACLALFDVRNKDAPVFQGYLYYLCQYGAISLAQLYVTYPYISEKSLSYYQDFNSIPRFREENHPDRKRKWRVGETLFRAFLKIAEEKSKEKKVNSFNVGTTELSRNYYCHLFQKIFGKAVKLRTSTEDPDTEEFFFHGEPILDSLGDIDVPLSLLFPSKEKPNEVLE